MSFRRWFPFVLCLWVACGKDDKPEPEKETPKPAATAGDHDKRCLMLGKLCGDKAKHVDKIVEECKEAAKQQTAKGCTEKANAAYECYERELCGKSDKVWSMADFGVLVARHKMCAAERTALDTCIGK